MTDRSFALASMSQRGAREFHIAEALGSPCPSIIITNPDTSTNDDIVDIASEARTIAKAASYAYALKIGLVSLADDMTARTGMSYRFVQVVPRPDGSEDYDLQGSCGHTLLASVLTAARLGWFSRQNLLDGISIHLPRSSAEVTVHTTTLSPTCMSIESLLLRYSFRDISRERAVREATVATRFGHYEVTTCVVGNPYMFLDGVQLGLRNAEQLFAADERSLTILRAVQRAGAELFELKPDGAFPKVAVIVGDARNLAVRAVSIPSWHPGFAVTGRISLGYVMSGTGTALNSRLQINLSQQGDMWVYTPRGLVRIGIRSDVTGDRHIEVDSDRILYHSQLGAGNIPSSLPLSGTRPAVSGYVARKR